MEARDPKSEREDLYVISIWNNGNQDEFFKTPVSPNDKQHCLCEL